MNHSLNTNKNSTTGAIFSRKYIIFIKYEILNKKLIKFYLNILKRILIYKKLNFIL